MPAFWNPILTYSSLLSLRELFYFVSRLSWYKLTFFSFSYCRIAGRSFWAYSQVSHAVPLLNCRGNRTVPRMKSATQDKYGPDGPGSQTGGSGATELIVWTNFRSGRSVGPIPKLGLFGLAPHTWIGYVRSGQYPNIGLFRLVHAQSSVWPIDKHRSVSSGPYPSSVWPITRHWSVSSGPYPLFDLFRLAHTQSRVCLLWPISNLRSVWSGPYPILGLLW